MVVFGARTVLVRSLSLSAAIALATLTMVACAGSSNGQPVLTGAAPARLGADQRFVIIEGSNFARGAQAQLGGQPVTQLTWVNPSVLTGVAPAGMAPGSYDLSVTNPNGQSATLRGGIAVLAAISAAARPNSAPSAEPATTATVPAPAPTHPPSSPSPAAEPATRTPSVPLRAATQPPQRRPTATATPAPWGAAGQVDLTGRWQITDTVSYGAGGGQSFGFSVTFSQQGATFSGAGDGLSISGTVSGLTVEATYTQDNGSGGTFAWTLSADGSSFAGTFTNSRGNGGSSSGQRLSAAFAAAPGNEEPPTAAPQGNAEGRGGGKKKER